MSYLRYEAMIYLVKMFRVITFLLLWSSPYVLYANIFGALSEK